MGNVGYLMLRWLSGRCGMFGIFALVDTLTGITLDAEPRCG